MALSVNYSTYKNVAEKYVIGKKGNLDVLKTYDKEFEEIFLNHMSNWMRQNCNQNARDIKEAINTNKAYMKRFIDEHRG